MKEALPLPMLVDSGGFASLFENARIIETAGLGELEMTIDEGEIAWGLTPSAAAQQRSIWAFSAFGIMLLLLGALGWYAFIVAPWSSAIS